MSTPQNTRNNPGSNYDYENEERERQNLPSNTNLPSEHKLGTYEDELFDYLEGTKEIEENLKKSIKTAIQNLQNLEPEAQLQVANIIEQIKEKHGIDLLSSPTIACSAWHDNASNSTRINFHMNPSAYYTLKAEGSVSSSNSNFDNCDNGYPRGTITPEPPFGFIYDIQFEISRACENMPVTVCGKMYHYTGGGSSSLETRCCDVITPNFSPTPAPTPAPTKQPSPAPTNNPTQAPTPAPTKNPTRNPTSNPTQAPTFAPTPYPTPEPTPDSTFVPPPYIPSPSPDSTPSQISNGGSSGGINWNPANLSSPQIAEVVLGSFGALALSMCLYNILRGCCGGRPQEQQNPRVARGGSVQMSQPVIDDAKNPHSAAANPQGEQVEDTKSRCVVS